MTSLTGFEVGSWNALDLAVPTGPPRPPSTSSSPLGAHVLILKTYELSSSCKYTYDF